MAHRRSALPGLAALLVAACLLGSWLPGAFVPAPAAPRRAEAAVSVSAPERSGPPAGVLALGAGAGLLAAPPAHAGVLFDEVIPYAEVTSFSILWGIVLGFVLLRLQEAFPE
mmetsp:Transcript_138435/g.430465  ORF Transcript_138435/g.430465 Transcript_138435/m.430465 type:complete len:112 (-) Transcript_138435:159-494(-)